MDRCALEFDFGREIAIDEYQLGTANDCNSRDPLRWKMFASNDRNMWVQIVDQTRISFSMPISRTTATERIPITSLQAQSVPAAFSLLAISQSTNVVDALNTVSISFSINYKENCPPGFPPPCFRTDSSGAPIHESAPLGTVIHVGGFADVRTPESSAFQVHSIDACSTNGEDCSPVVSPDLNRWRHMDDGVGGFKGKLEFIFLRCLLTSRATVSFQTMNPVTRHNGQLVLEMRGDGTALIEPRQLEESDGSGVDWPSAPTLG